MPEWRDPLALGGLLLGGGVILLGGGGRLATLSLLGMYALWSALLVVYVEVSSGVALAKGLVGLLVFLILYPIASRMPQGNGSGVAAWPLRLAMLILAAVGAYGLYFRYPWEFVPGEVAYGVWWMMLVGLLTVLVSMDPLQIGIGLLIYELGFEMGFSAVERGILAAGFLGMVQILLALVTSYLATARAQAPSATKGSGEGGRV